MNEYIELSKEKFFALLEDTEPVDKIGTRKITQRAKIIREYPPLSAEKKTETLFISGLAKDLKDLNEIILIRLLNYIRTADLLLETIFDSFLKSLRKNIDELEDIQAAEVTRFLLNLKPAQVPMSLITEKLKALLTSNPWLYVDLVSKKNIYNAVNYIQLLIKSNNFDSGYFTALFSKWCNEKSKEEIEYIYRSIRPLIEKKSVLTIIDYEAEQAGINTGEGVLPEIPVLASKISAVVVQSLSDFAKGKPIRHTRKHSPIDQESSQDIEFETLSNNEIFQGFKKRSKSQFEQSLEPSYA